MSLVALSVVGVAAFLFTPMSYVVMIPLAMMIGDHDAERRREDRIVDHKRKRRSKP